MGYLNETLTHHLHPNDVNVTAEQAIDILNRHTARMGVFFNVHRICDYITAEQFELKPLYREWRLMLGVGETVSINSRKEVLPAIKRRLGLSDEDLRASDFKSEVSFSNDVRQRLIDDPTMSDEVKHFCKLHARISALSKDISSYNQYLALPLSNELSADGSPMTIAHPRWCELSTGRISAKDPGLQTIARGRCDILTYPKGFLYVRADSGQIEPRIQWSHFTKDIVLSSLIRLYNDAYYGQLHYALMSNEELAMYRKDPSLLEKKPIFTMKELDPILHPETHSVEEVRAVLDKAATYSGVKRLLFDLHERGVKRPPTFEELKPHIILKELRQDLKVLALSASYGRQDFEGVDPVLVAGYMKRIVQHPEKIRLEREYRDMAERGIDYCTTAFGTRITPQETDKYKPGSKSWITHLVRCFINNPIQGTAADLMNVAIRETDKIIMNEAKGLTAINFDKHDELAIIVDPKDKDLIPRLGNMTSYQVYEADGTPWIPIFSEREDGVKRPSKDVMAQYPIVDTYDSVAEREWQKKKLMRRFGLSH